MHKASPKQHCDIQKPGVQVLEVRWSSLAPTKFNKTGEFSTSF